MICGPFFITSSKLKKKKFFKTREFAIEIRNVFNTFIGG